MSEATQSIVQLFCVVKRISLLSFFLQSYIKIHIQMITSALGRSKWSLAHIEGYTYISFQWRRPIWPFSKLWPALRPAVCAPFMMEPLTLRRIDRFIWHVPILLAKSKNYIMWCKLRIIWMSEKQFVKFLVELCELSNKVYGLVFSCCVTLWFFCS